MNPERILVVEDSRAESMVLLHCLEREYPKATIDICNSLEDIDRLASYGLIILDLMTPSDREPEEAVKHIADTFPDTPIMVRSNIEDTKLVERIMDHDNVTMWCAKGNPDNIANLGERTRRAIKLWRAIRSTRQYA